jgi:pyridoxal phosphate enzyme (YggS family)
MEQRIASALARIEERIAASCLRSGRRREELRLMGVSKFHPLEAVEAARKAGLLLFGEIRVREGIEKFSASRERHPGEKAEVHLIGSLQRNKTGAAAAFFDGIQSVDRESLIEELGKVTAGREEPLPVLLELHTGEESKAGFDNVDDLCRAAEKLLSCPGLAPAGLMTMAPFTDDEKTIRTSFRALVKARAELAKRFPVPGAWSCLSMGMSGDFELAVEEGSTLVRIGTAIFGERPQS